MRTLLPSRCPIPALCERSWHWTAEARDRCQFLQQEERAERAFVALELPYSYGSWEHREYEQKARKRAEAVAAHVPVQPTLPEDIALTRNGERQLITLGPRQLSTVGLLMASDIYRINRLLRNGGSLASGANAMIDWEGYRSMQEFVDAACGVFDDLGDSLALDEPIRLFRGIGVPESPDEQYPDVAGISHHLTTGTPWHEEFVDAGFGFATTDPQTALFYDGSDSSEYPPKRPVLLELDTHRGLCAPQKEHRSTGLFEHSFESRFLSTATGQVIFRPDTQWDLISIDKDSKYGVPLVRMRQIVPTTVIADDVGTMGDNSITTTKQ